MSEYPISITKIDDALVCSIDMWRDVQEKIDRFFAERMEEEAVRQLREIGFERVVRCRDCKRFSLDDSDHDYRSGWWCHRWNTDMVKPDGFCAWGERRNA